VGGFGEGHASLTDLHPRRKHQWKGSVAIRLGLMLVMSAPVGFASGCGKPQAAAAASEGEEDTKPTPVVIGTAYAGPITATITAASTIEAERQVTVHAESTGRITRLEVEEGDQIAIGTLLARIEADAQAAGLDRADTNLTQARADFEAVGQLFAKKAASREELDAAKLAYDSARLDVKDRRRDVRNTRVTAPFSGTVIERFVSEGAFVTSGAQLVTIIDFDTLVARVFVPEKELDRIAVGQPAAVVGKAARGRKGVGIVERIAPVVDATTGTVKVTIRLPDQLAGNTTDGFLPGMYAEVTLTTERREWATLVAKQALVREDDDATFIFVVRGDVAERRPVTIGLQDSDRVEVLSGLVPGDEVVVTGQAGLKDGAIIERVDASGAPQGIDASAPDSDGLAHRDASKPAGGA
jgi:membrane fusion protein (multidrug efflux system)